MQLLPFDTDLAATVVSWPTSPAEAALWCGHRDGPVPVEKVVSWSAEDGVHAYGLFDDGQLVAYGEIWLDDDEGEVELARLIVDSRRRANGIGRILVTQLVAQALTNYPDIFLRVHPDNVAALRCYAGAKFVRVGAEQETEWNAPQPVPYIWLTYRP
jgi:[ribosomal protein S18]-alanine N-acetyltransferase